MLQLPNADVTRVAKETAYFFGVVAVVDVKSPFTFWLVGLANGTPSLLRGQQCFILVYGYAVVFFKLIAFEASWVFLVGFSVAFF